MRQFAQTGTSRATTKYSVMNLENMNNLGFFENKKSYEDFEKQIDRSIKPLFELIRSYCLSLGKNVVEDVRMHRIVFGKSITCRSFADVEPLENSILVKVRRDRNEPQKEIEVTSEQGLSELKKLILEAYNAIH